MPYDDYTGYEQPWELDSTPDLNYDVYNPVETYPVQPQTQLNPTQIQPNVDYNQYNGVDFDMYDTQPSYNPSMYRNPSTYTAGGAPLNESQLNLLFQPQSSPAIDDYAVGGANGVFSTNSEDEDKPAWMKALAGMGMPQVSKGQADVLKSLAGLYSAYQGRKQASQLRNAAGQMDPFAGQRPQYQELLSQSYSNPRAFAQTPESRMQMDALQKQLARLDAKSGRRSQYGARAVQMQTEQAKLLDNYRKGLIQPSGANFGPNATQGTLLSNAAQTDMNASGQLPQALSQIYSKQDPQYAALDARIKAFEDAFPRKA
jgi:hypothetical protein